jgi:hypothetical protein
MAVGRISGTTNWRGVVLGDLIAGVSINAVQIAFHGGGGRRRKLVVPPSTDPIARAPAIVRYAGLHFSIGITAAWLYATARPCYGPGPSGCEYAHGRAVRGGALRDNGILVRSALSRSAGDLSPRGAAIGAQGARSARGVSFSLNAHDRPTSAQAFFTNFIVGCGAGCSSVMFTTESNTTKNPGGIPGGPVRRNRFGVTATRVYSG